MKIGTLALMVGLTAAPAAAEEIAVRVNGMVCSFCAQGIIKKFKAQKPVEAVRVDLDTKLVHVTTKKDLPLDDAAIREVIEYAGYEVAAIERK